MYILLGFLGFIVGMLWCVIGAREMSNRKSKIYIACLFMAIAWMCAGMLCWCEQISINYGF
jgi:hypothetical protein